MGVEDGPWKFCSKRGVRWKVACTNENSAGLKAADLTSCGYMIKSWCTKPTGFQLNQACPPTSGNSLRNLNNGW